jgi:hypothetical protein
MRSESYGQSFEYDEGSDEGDESFEASDEASDEGDESFEASDEASDEGDESFEASDEASDEADEGYDEADEAADESDEAVDEALSASARLSARVAADRDRARSQKWRAQLASDRRREAQAASAVQQSLTSRLRDIRGSGRTRTMTLGNLSGVRRMEMTLANGRKAVVQVAPPLASASEVNRLRGIVNTNERRRAASDAANSRAINRLAAAQTNFVKAQTAQQVRSDRELGKRIVEVGARLDKRITTELASQKVNIAKHDKRIFRRIKRVRYQMLMNDVLLASALPIYAAYGKQGSPFDNRNLALTGILGGFLIGDELIGMATGMGKSSKAMNTLSTTWATLAPIGNGLTDFLLFRKKQNTRFVTGTTIIPATLSTVPAFDVPVATGSFADFSALPEVSVVATVVSSAPATVMASVSKGQLTLTLSAAAPVGGATVAWVVDTEGVTPAVV